MNTLHKKRWFLTLIFSLLSFSVQSSDDQEFNDENQRYQTKQELEEDLSNFIAKRTYPSFEESKKNTVIGALYAEEWSRTRQRYDFLAALHYFGVAIDEFKDADAKRLARELQRQGKSATKQKEVLRRKCLEATTNGESYETIGGLYEALYSLSNDPADKEYADFYLERNEEMSIDYSQRNRGLIFPTGNSS